MHFRAYPALLFLFLGANAQTVSPSPVAGCLVYRCDLASRPIAPGCPRPPSLFAARAFAASLLPHTAAHFNSGYLAFFSAAAAAAAHAARSLRSVSAHRAPPPSPPRRVRVENTPGVANQNFYELAVFDFSGVNRALNKPTTSFSAASYGVSQGPAFAGADGVWGEGSYYNSNGITSSEFWQVNLTAPVAAQSITFYNRAAITTTCWTPPAAWTAKGIAGGCDTRAINQTLRVLDDQGATLQSFLLTSALNQTFAMACAPSPSVTPAPTASLTTGASPSASTTATFTPSGSPTPSPTQTPAVPLPSGASLSVAVGSLTGAFWSVPALGCAANFSIKGGGGGSASGYLGGQAASFAFSVNLPGGTIIFAQSAGGGALGGSGGGAAALTLAGGTVIAVAGGGGGSNYKVGGNAGPPGGNGSAGGDYSATALCGFICGGGFYSVD